MSRMRWLDSTIGIDDAVPSPFSSVGHVVSANGSLLVSAVNKDVSIGTNGLPESFNVHRRVKRMGKTVLQSHSVLAKPIAVEILDSSGAVIPQTVCGA